MPSELCKTGSGLSAKCREDWAMPRFLNLSQMTINLDTIRVVTRVPEQTTAGKGPGCMVRFVGSREPYGFYGKDAEAILTLVGETTIGSSAPGTIREPAPAGVGGD